MRQVGALLPFLFVSFLWLAKLVGAFNIFGKGSSSSSFSVNIPTTTTAAEPIQVRIRTTRESDIATVASFLSSSSPNDDDDDSISSGAWNTFKSQLDQMQASMEITSLLKGRAAVLREGKKTYNRLLQEVKEQQQQQQQSSTSTSLLLSSHEMLQLWWNRPYNHVFKSLLEKASQQTGEPNVWQGHNFALTPPEPAWLRHVQMTAVVVAGATENESINNMEKEIIVGFCEVALLENPLFHDNVKQDGSDSDNNSNNDSNNAFRPAITNLATASAYRRRGIAQRLLLAAERYAQYYWYFCSATKDGDSSNSHNNESSASASLGLFVEQDNAAAINLYEKMGYRRTVACSGGSQLGDMWYMVKDFADKLDTEKPTTATTTNTNGAHSSSSAVASEAASATRVEIPQVAAEEANGSSSSLSAEAAPSEIPFEYNKTAVK